MLSPSETWSCSRTDVLMFIFFSESISMGHVTHGTGVLNLFIAIQERWNLLLDCTDVIF